MLPEGAPHGSLLAMVEPSCTLQIVSRLTPPKLHIFSVSCRWLLDLFEAYHPRIFGPRIHSGGQVLQLPLSTTVQLQELFRRLRGGHTPGSPLSSLGPYNQVATSWSDILFHIRISSYLPHRENSGTKFRPNILGLRRSRRRLLQASWLEPSVQRSSIIGQLEFMNQGLFSAGDGL